MLAQLKEFPGRTGQMQKLQDVHEAYQVLTKVTINNSKQLIIKTSQELRMLSRSLSDC